ncbi:hypothetical protein GSI_03182 [Ganoderma sinense ZZ0214-1]|uniref:AB hydrolase-1 domain-containing protein n=1 Tax=Ganoderma sinense ZZ0214-1 TaxID=1077348 RepID=A0A2G8SKX3_9APHY|nr:hypothetical protein GSI_03182 [Ganoderma sinense ZZ0214-1]
MSDTALSIYQDSGPPAGSADYTTLVLVHGFAWHSGIFAKLIPLAAGQNTRIVLVNRRDYPGATPFSPEDHAVLQAAMTSDAATAHAQLVSFMQDRAREVVDLLARFVQANKIPLAQHEEKKGGIVIGGWSFGTAWMSSLLAYRPSVPTGDIDGGVELSKYVRRVIFYDSPYHVLGFAPPPAPHDYNPLFDPAIPPADQTRVFANWVSGYFAHRTNTPALAAASAASSVSDADKLAAAATFEVRAHLTAPPPTLSILTPDEVAAALFPAPGDPGGSDSLLVAGGIPCGVFVTLREAALAIPTDEAWCAIEVRHVWCDRSVWETTWTTWNLRWRIAEARKKGEKLREVTSVRLEGANHFVHWDEPERALAAFLTDEAEKY